MVSQDEINSNFLDVIRWLKSEYGYTQAYIVEKAELAPNAISKIKNGKANAGDETITKLCSSFGLNPDYFYGRSCYRTKLEEKREKLDENLLQAQKYIQPQPYIDPGSQINAIIAAKDQLIEELQNKYEAMEREKDERINELKELAEERLHRIAELRRIIDSHNISITDYPFPVGAAEKHNQKHI
jgi:transcriptional regulator with XRE-family HTH domain